MTESTNQELEKVESAGGLMLPSSLPAPAVSDEDAASLMTAWLPRLQLMVSQSEQCKDGSFPLNHYALVRGKDLQDLGDAVDILIMSFRVKAVEMGEAIITAYDKDSTEFKRIQDADKSDGVVRMFGPEFLVYIPAVKEYALFFCGSASARIESAQLIARWKKWQAGEVPQPAVTLKSQKLQNSNYTWFAPRCVSCSEILGVPDLEKAREEIEKFKNPPKALIETAEETEERAR